LKNTGLETQGNIGNLIQLDKALEMVKSGVSLEDYCKPVPSPGDVQILLSWNNYNDLDLYCTDPQGATVWYKNKSVQSGGQLEIDMNVENFDSKNPIEHIYWQVGGAPNGIYNVYLKYYKKHEPTVNETPYSITVKYGNKTEEFKGNIKQEDNTLHICTFTLRAANNTLNANPNTPDNNRKRNLLQEREKLQQELNRIDKELRNIGNNNKNIEK
jgi:hypothetical protein